MQYTKPRLKFKNQSKLLLVLDWLTLNIIDCFSNLDLDSDGVFQFKVKTELSDTPIEYDLELIKGRNTRHFDKVFNIWREGEKVATLACGSISPRILVNRAHLKLENHTFYGDTSEQIINEFLTYFNISEVAISRVDVACDGVHFNNFIYQYATKNYKKTIGRVDNRDNINLNNFRASDLGNRKIDSFTVGTFQKHKSKSIKFARYYNKSKELRDLEHKEYIKEWHLLNGFKEHDTYRFEFELKGEFLKTVEGFHWTDIFDYCKLQKLFRTCITGFFEFYYKDRTRVNRCTRVDMFKGITKAKYKRCRPTVKSKVRTVQIGIKRDVIDEVTQRFNDTAHWCGANNVLSVQSKLDRYQLHEWFADRFPKIIKECQKDARLSRQELSVHHCQIETWTTNGLATYYDVDLSEVEIDQDELDMSRMNAQHKINHKILDL